MKVWITKYALTDGILEREATGVYASGVVIDGGLMFFPNDYHYTQEAATLRAKQMQAKRIASLTKSLNKIKALDFGGAQ